MTMPLFRALPLFSVLTLAAALPAPAEAKPVTWPGGYQVMLMNDQDMNAAHLMYTVTPKFSIQNRADYMRADKTTIGGIQGNWLLKRWNFPNAQANIYASLGAGAAHNAKEDNTAAAGFAGMLADYETRRFIISYEADGTAAGNVTNQLWHRGRIGFAPYAGEYDDLHTWFMLQTDYRPNMENEVSVMPMIRLFKTDWMLEGGVSHRGEGMLNLIVQF